MTPVQERGPAAGGSQGFLHGLALIDKDTDVAFRLSQRQRLFQGCQRRSRLAEDVVDQSLESEGLDAEPGQVRAFRLLPQPVEERERPAHRSGVAGSASLSDQHLNWRYVQMLIGIDKELRSQPESRRSLVHLHAPQPLDGGIEVPLSQTELRLEGGKKCGE